MSSKNFTKDGKRIFKNAGFISGFYVESEGGGTSDVWATREDYISGIAYRIPKSYYLWATFNKIDKWVDSNGEHEELKTKKVKLGEINKNKEYFKSFNVKVGAAVSKTEEVILYILNNVERYASEGITLYKEMVQNNSYVYDEHPEWSIDKNEAEFLLILFMAVFDMVYNKDFTTEGIKSIDAKMLGKICYEKMEEIRKDIL